MDFLCGNPLKQALIDGEDYDDYTDGKAPQALCENVTSISGFLTDTDCKVNYTMDSVDDFIDGLTDIIVALDTAEYHLGRAAANVSILRGVVSDLKATSSDLNDNLEALDSFRLSINSNSIPVYDSTDYSVPEISDQDITDLNDAVSSITTAEADITEAGNDADQTIRTDLQVTTAAEIDTNSAEISDEITTLQDDVLKFMKDSADSRKDVLDLRDEYDDWRTTIMASFIGIFSLSCIFLLIALIGFCTERTRIVQCAGVCMLLTVGILCVFLGFVVVMYLLTDDVCGVWLDGNEESAMRGLFEVNLEGQEQEFGDITIDPAAVVNAVFTCSGGCLDITSNCGDAPDPSTTNTGCTAINNLVNIMGIGQEFNFSAEVQDSIDLIEDYSPQLNYSTEIADARAQLGDESVNASLHNDLSSNYDSTEIHSALDLTEQSLPTCNSNGCVTADLDSDECDRWAAIWQYTDCTCSDLESATVSSSSETKTYYAWNCELVDLVDQTRTNVNTTDTLIANGTSAQEALQNTFMLLDAALGEIDRVVLVKQDELQAQSALLSALTSYIYQEAPGHFQCEWIAEAFETTLQTDYCKNAYDNIESVIPGMSFSIFSILIGFFTMLEVANPRRSLKLEPNPRKAGLTSHNWKHPNEHPDGPIDEHGRVRDMSSPAQVEPRHATASAATPLAGEDSNYSL